MGNAWGVLCRLPPRGILCNFGLLPVMRSVELHRIGSEEKNMPATQELQETQVQSQGREDPLEESMATHSSILV